MVRTTLTWRILGENLVGTCHVPTSGRAVGRSGSPSVGILLLNPGSATRSGNSDLSIRIGDRLALRGFPVFRFDLSGLGDSSGPTPADLDTYWNDVVDGRNDAATVALIERIQLEFGLARIIVGGLCAAALPSVRALSHANAAPAGLILLEPNFRLVIENKLDRPQPATRVTLIGTIAAQLWRALSAVGLSRESRVARATQPLRALFQRVLRWLVVPSLPSDANVQLITRWQESFVRGVHSLVVVADGQPTDRYVTRILESMPDGTSEVVACVRVPETNHLFTSGTGRDAVLAALERWVMECFGGNSKPHVHPESGS